MKKKSSETSVMRWQKIGDNDYSFEDSQTRNINLYVKGESVTNPT